MEFTCGAWKVMENYVECTKKLVFFFAKKNSKNIPQIKQISEKMVKII